MRSLTSKARQPTPYPNNIATAARTRVVSIVTNIPKSSRPQNIEENSLPRLFTILLRNNQPAALTHPSVRTTIIDAARRQIVVLNLAGRALPDRRRSETPARLRKPSTRAIPRSRAIHSRHCKTAGQVVTSEKPWVGPKLDSTRRPHSLRLGTVAALNALASRRETKRSWHGRDRVTVRSKAPFDPPSSRFSRRERTMVESPQPR